MKHCENLRDAFEVCSAIGSPVRLEILEHIIDNKSVNLGTLAKTLHLTGGALTKHIKKLEDAGLIRITLSKGKRGWQKQCSVCQDAILIDVSNEFSAASGDEHELPIGLYSDFSVSGHCGLVSTAGYIGMRDERDAFLSSFRAKAAALWLESGHLTYLLPEPKRKKTVEEMSLTFELSADFTGLGSENGSKIDFLINGVNVGSVELFAQKPERRGFLNPDWYPAYLSQYGSLHTLTVGSKGTFLDGEKLSGQTVTSVGKPERFTIETKSGLMLFGAGFGDYNGHIRISIKYAQ